MKTLLVLASILLHQGVYEVLQAQEITPYFQHYYELRRTNVNQPWDTIADFEQFLLRDRMVDRQTINRAGHGSNNNEFYDLWGADSVQYYYGDTGVDSITFYRKHPLELKMKRIKLITIRRDNSTTVTYGYEFNGGISQVWSDSVIYNAHGDVLEYYSRYGYKTVYTYNSSNQKTNVSRYRYIGTSYLIESTWDYYYDNNGVLDSAIANLSIQNSGPVYLDIYEVQNGLVTGSKQFIRKNGVDEEINRTQFVYDQDLRLTYSSMDRYDPTLGWQQYSEAMYIYDNWGRLIEETNILPHSIRSYRYVFASPTGTEEVNSHAEVYIYPNPATHHVNLESDGASEGYEVFDQKGSLMLFGQLSNRKTDVIDIQELESGVYFLRITSESGITSKSFIKL